MRHLRQTYKLHFLAGHVRDVHVVGGRAQFFQLFAGEDIQSNKVDLGVTVLSGLGGGHVNDLTGAVLDHNETILAESGTLHGEGGGGTGISALKGVFMLLYAMISIYALASDLRAPAPAPASLRVNHRP